MPDTKLPGGNDSVDAARDAPAPFLGHSDGLARVTTPSEKYPDGVYLQFDSIDEDGFGHAHNPKNDDQFLVGKRALSIAEGEGKKLSKNMQFLAEVNVASFVTRVQHLA